MITKSGYLYEVSGKLNGQDFSKEIKSFNKLEDYAIMGQIIAGQTAINLANVKLTIKEVVYGIDEKVFLNEAKIMKVKETGNEKKAGVKNG